jgi:hypothetical protein
LGRLRLGCSRLDASEIEYKTIFIAGYVAKKHVKRSRDSGGLLSYVRRFRDAESLYKAPQPPCYRASAC